MEKIGDGTLKSVKRQTRIGGVLMRPPNASAFLPLRTVDLLMKLKRRLRNVNLGTLRKLAKIMNKPGKGYAAGSIQQRSLHVGHPSFFNNQFQKFITIHAGTTTGGFHNDATIVY